MIRGKITNDGFEPMTQYQKVKEFMEAMGQKMDIKDDNRLLRAKLVSEECYELIDALGFCETGPTWELALIKHHDDVDMVDIVDALCDLHYVAYCGTAIAFGISEEKMSRIFDVIHETNMNKMWTLEEAAQHFIETKPEHWIVSACVNCGGTNTQCYPTNRCRVVVTNAAGKVIKPPGWKNENREKIAAILAEED